MLLYYVFSFRQTKLAVYTIDSIEFLKNLDSYKIVLFIILLIIIVIKFINREYNSKVGIISLLILAFATIVQLRYVTAVSGSEELHLDILVYIAAIIACNKIDYKKLYLLYLL